MSIEAECAWCGVDLSAEESSLMGSLYVHIVESARAGTEAAAMIAISGTRGPGASGRIQICI
jgi:hypothetical protein